jgi:hypothetical protein
MADWMLLSPRSGCFSYANLGLVTELHQVANVCIQRTTHARLRRLQTFLVVVHLENYRTPGVDITIARPCSTAEF